jgi:hypothetical protein
MLTEPGTIPKLFVNQHNIKDVVTSSRCIELLDWSGAKLKSLKIGRDGFDYNNKESIDRALKGQDEMEQLSCCDVNLSLLKPLFKELKSLVELEIGISVPCTEGLPELSKLSNLKVLEIYCYGRVNPRSADINNFLNLTHHSGVEKLNISCGKAELPELTIVQLSVNFPSVKELTLRSKSSINVTNTILQSFPNLASLHFFPNGVVVEDYIYQEGLRHENLKKLHITMWNGINNDFAKLIGCCVKLEEFSAISLPNKNSLKEIFTLQPNLKSFTLSNRNIKKIHITKADIAAVKENGKKLETFLIIDCSFYDKSSPKKLQEKFGDQFDTVRVERNQCSSTYTWEMYKTSKKQ